MSTKAASRGGEWKNWRQVKPTGLENPENSITKSAGLQNNDKNSGGAYGNVKSVR